MSDEADKATTKLLEMAAKLAADMLPLSDAERFALATQVGGIMARQLFAAGYPPDAVERIVSDLLQGAEAMLAAMLSGDGGRA